MRVRVAANFRRDLESIRAFLEDRETPEEFERLLDRLFDTVVVNLERFPEMGADLLARVPGSAEGITLLRRVHAKLPRGGSVRQLISGDYVFLYLLQEEVVLLAVKHHRQLSFDLASFWEE